VRSAALRGARPVFNPDPAGPRRPESRICPWCFPIKSTITMGKKPHQSQLLPRDNKFHAGNGADGKHY
jgi:hypothetical protein